jgi:hypothetical protein
MPKEALVLWLVGVVGAMVAVDSLANDELTSVFRESEDKLYSLGGPRRALRIRILYPAHSTGTIPVGKYVVV